MARNLVYIDQLTGLPNSEFLFRCLSSAVMEAEGTDAKIGLGVFSIRDFEHMEEVNGRPLTDALLTSVARAASDLEPLTAYVSKGQFSALFVGIGSEEEAASQAKRFIADLSGDYDVNGRLVQTELYGGISLYPDHATDANELLRKAHVSLNRTKSESGTFTVYAPSIELFPQDQILLSELKSVLANDGLTWMYQPQFSVRERKITGAEILARWIHPKFGVVPADHFIPLAEQAGLINQLTSRVIKQAVETLTAWKAESRECRLSINMSANDLEATFRIKEILAQFQGFCSHITLEITETAIMRNLESIIQNADELKNAEFKLSLDDYGTGYSSLAYLKDFNFDEIKIDSCFVKDLARSERNLALTKASIALAHELGAVVVAEGVEDMETARLLIGMGCDILQGYAISRPLYLDQLNRLLEGSNADFLGELDSGGIASPC